MSAAGREALKVENGGFEVRESELKYQLSFVLIIISIALSNTTISFRMGFHWPPFTLVRHLHLHVIAPVSEMSVLSRIMFASDSYWFVSAENVILDIEKRAKHKQPQ